MNSFPAAARSVGDLDPVPAETGFRGQIHRYSSHTVPAWIPKQVYQINFMDRSQGQIYL